MASAPPDAIDQALAGRVIAVAEARQLDVLAGLLERRGAAVRRCPLVGIKDSLDTGSVVSWLERRNGAQDDLLVCYTGEGIERLYGFAERAALDAQFLDYLKRTPKLTRGPKPKRALRRLGLDAEYEAATPTTAGLVVTAATIALPASRVAVQLYSETQDRELLEHFRARGAEPDCVAPYVYASAAEDADVVALVGELGAGRIDAIAFTSKTQVQRLLRLAADNGLTQALHAGLARTRVAAVGPIVATELGAAGVRVDATPEDSYTMKPLVTSICALLGAPP
jgi:uroporphyrinogen-III synthase